mgnify:CR=1 FL=1
MSNIKGRERGKVTSSELKLIQEQQNKVNSILVEIGYQESRKHALLHDLSYYWRVEKTSQCRR